MSTLNLRIAGMDCADCAATLEKGVGGLAGVQICTVNFSTARMLVEYDPAHVREAEIAHRIRTLGYEVQSDHAAGKPAARLRRGGILGFVPYLFARRSTALAAIGGILVGVGMLAEFFQAPGVFSKTIYWLALAVAGYPIFNSGLRRLWVNREVGINLLMSLAAIGALVIGEEAEAATVIFLFALGEALEGYTADPAIRVFGDT